ncbi:MAG TPA: dienelactone hydrolase family protein [Stellaceae bacterium]|nr:dienelactone hydrolase family protein [Stellaceae bacterium]
MKTETIDYSDGAVSMSGYLAYDDSLAGKRPGVLVVHEAFGLGEHAMERARMLAKLGYVALAADMFGDRQQADLTKGIALITELKSQPLVLRARAGAAMKALTALPQVDATRLGGIGFCFGGTVVLEMARGGADLKGVVSFHGSLETPMPAAPGQVKSSILVCTGAEDPMIPATQVLAFEDEMRVADADWQVVSYSKTVHSFTNPEADGSMMPAIKYNKLSDQRSWSAMTGFLAEVFGTP